MEELTPGLNGLPPKKKTYTAEEKATLVAKAAEVGVHAWLRLMALRGRLFLRGKDKMISLSSPRQGKRSHQKR